jgi:hypothetical protein
MIFLAMKKIISPKYLDASTFTKLKLCSNEEEMTETLKGFEHHNDFMKWLDEKVEKTKDKDEDHLFKVLYLMSSEKKFSNCENVINKF